MPSKVSASGFAAIPYKLMDQADAPTWAVYAVLHRHGWNSDQGCWVSIKTIHDETGISQSVIRRSLAWLRETGWISSIERPGFTTVHHVKTDAPTPLTNLTPVKNDRGNPLQKRQGTPIKNVRGPLSKTTDEQEPINKNPRTRTQGAQAPKKDPNRLKALPSASIPFELDDCAELLIEFWSVKKGTRSSQVLTRVCNKLKQMTPAQRQDALERAIASGWGDVFIPRPNASQSASQAPEMKHPAHRVFTAENGFNEPFSNPILDRLIK